MKKIASLAVLFSFLNAAYVFCGQQLAPAGVMESSEEKLDVNLERAIITVLNDPREIGRYSLFKDAHFNNLDLNLAGNLADIAVGLICALTDKSIESNAQNAAEKLRTIHLNKIKKDSLKKVIDALVEVSEGPISPFVANAIADCLKQVDLNCYPSLSKLFACLFKIKSVGDNGSTKKVYYILVEKRFPEIGDINELNSCVHAIGEMMGILPENGYSKATTITGIVGNIATIYNNPAVNSEQEKILGKRLLLKLLGSLAFEPEKEYLDARKKRAEVFLLALNDNKLYIVLTALDCMKCISFSHKGADHTLILKSLFGLYRDNKFNGNEDIKKSIKNTLKSYDYDNACDINRILNTLLFERKTGCPDTSNIADGILREIGSDRAEPYMKSVVQSELDPKVSFLGTYCSL